MPIRFTIVSVEPDGHLLLIRALPGDSVPLLHTVQNQRYRASGLNLAVAAVILWNTVYLRRAVDELRAQGDEVPDDQLAGIAPLGWEHISFSGDYIWPAEPLRNQFRPLRNPRSPFLDGP